MKALHYSILPFFLMLGACREKPATVGGSSPSAASGASPGKSAERNAGERPAGAEKQRGPSDLDKAKSATDLRRWIAGTSKRGIMSEEDARALANALERIAKERGMAKEDVVADVLANPTPGDLPGIDCDALVAALGDEPLVFIRGTMKGLEGRMQGMTAVVCLSRLARSGEVESLETVYEGIGPGAVRTQAAGFLAASEFRRSGLDASLQRIEGFESADERRTSLMDVTHAIFEKGETDIPQADLARLQELARNDGFEKAIQLTISMHQKRLGLDPK